MSERRLESRFLCADLVRVTWSPNMGETRTAEALLEDISHVGGCVQIDEPIPENSELKLSIGSWSFTGSVSYCCFRDYGYFVGIRFGQDCVWSSDRVTPRHLTDLEMLLCAPNSTTADKRE